MSPERQRRGRPAGKACRELLPRGVDGGGGRRAAMAPRRRRPVPCAAMSTPEDPRIEALRERREGATLGGGAEAIGRQHERGKLTARERIDLLADPGTFEEID